MRNPKRLTLSALPRNQPLDAEIYATPGTAVLFTIRAERGAPFAERPEFCGAIIDLLRESRATYRCWVGAYCLMPDHLHLVAGPLEMVSVLTFVERFKGRSTNHSWTYGCSGKLWQNRQHDHVVRSTEALEDINAYVLQNPVRAGLVEQAEDWPWSGVMDEH